MKKEIDLGKGVKVTVENAVSIDENYIPAKDAFDIPKGVIVKYKSQW